MVASYLEMPIVQCHEKYLGLRTEVDKGQKQLFGAIKEVGKKVCGWKEKLISRASKEILIKAVLQAIPIYTMSCFWISKGTCKEIHAFLANYWWFKAKNEKGILVKQVWWLFTNNGSLVEQVYRARYYPTNTLLHAGVGVRSSFIWQSLVWGKELLLRELRWPIGNGIAVSVYNDPWIP
ncbi:hypothetical protein ACFX2J_035078 [Malus domestica]